MPKNAEFQKELKQKIKPGVKASDLKRLKRSKSVGDIPLAPTSPTNKIKALESQISTLELKLEVKDREITERDIEIKELKNNPPTQLLTDQLKEKQSQIEKLRQQLENKPTLTELDTSLQARHQNLKA
jgi:predicted RNase H-like nuclease (RuvC/YqgF family)